MAPVAGRTSSAVPSSADSAEGSREASASPRSSSVGPADESDDGKGVQMILRIKRKRNQDPVDALIIQQNERRQKRRSMVLPDPDSTATDTSTSNDVDQESDRTGSRGLFRLAETVSLASFQDPVAAKRLHQRISALSGGRGSSDSSSAVAVTSKPAISSKLSQSVSLPALSSSLEKDQSKDLPARSSLHPKTEERTDELFSSPALSTSASGRSTPSTRTIDRVKALASAHVGREREKQLRPRSSTPTGMRFKVIQKEQAYSSGLRRTGSSSSLRRMRSSAGPVKPWQVPARPPEIRSRKEREAEAIFGRIIDAEAQYDKAASRRSDRCKKPGNALDDAEMAGLDAKFADMLGEYLRSNDIEPSEDLDRLSAMNNAAHSMSQSNLDTSDGEEEDDRDDGDEDYVYDVYYRDVMPSRAGPQGSAESGLQPATVAGRQKVSGLIPAVPESMAVPRVVGGEVVPPETDALASSSFLGLDIVGPNAVIAHLEGFQDSDDELEQADDEGFESYDEGEDEDSNDEGFYRNDYPEQELPDDDGDFDLGSDRYDDSDPDREEDDPYALSDGSF
ncbi:hypothetical protein BCV70DRAFT_174907 [Testicularia cyperi]|uniref:Transcription factor Iwr1 domain-containing protein n=1 Tax=Testicularia cyperi TaxID=1882483 RepID=A0A317XRV0_9BASI|nr:hypothetical protein BCV70DRAFT_174907 [Testicularia cyperi]